MRDDLAELMETHSQDPAHALTPLHTFTHTSLQREHCVSGVFVRIYINNPAFPLSDHSAFCKGLVTHLH